MPTHPLPAGTCNTPSQFSHLPASEPNSLYSASEYILCVVRTSKPVPNNGMRNNILMQFGVNNLGTQSMVAPRASITIR